MKAVQMGALAAYAGRSVEVFAIPAPEDEDAYAYFLAADEDEVAARLAPPRTSPPRPRTRRTRRTTKTKIPPPYLRKVCHTMSTDFRLSDPSKGMVKDALLAALAPHGVSEGVPEEPSDGFLLTDGGSCLWAYPDDDGLVTSFTVFAQSSNDTSGIIGALEEVCDDEILSEHDEGFFEDEDEDD
jgi:hypothetical protein